MDFRAANSHDFGGRRCRACQFKVSIEDPIAVDIDGESIDGERQMTASVEHWRCYQVQLEATAKAYDQAAVLASRWGATSCAAKLREAASSRRQWAAGVVA